jgi:hypothetical protein
MQPDRNSAAQIRPAAKRCPDCGESQARLRTVDPGRETRLAKSRSAAARRLIAAHLEEYRALLEFERQRQLDAEVVLGGGPDAA